MRNYSIQELMTLKSAVDLIIDQYNGILSANKNTLNMDSDFDSLPAQLKKYYEKRMNFVHIRENIMNKLELKVLEEIKNEN